MKTGEKVRLGALRLLMRRDQEPRGSRSRHELTDDEVREIAGKEVKKRTESIEAFDAAGRDRARRRRSGPSARSSPSSPPTQLSDDAVDALIDEALAATGATSLKEMGKVMGVRDGQGQGPGRRYGRAAEGLARLGEPAEDPVRAATRRRAGRRTGPGRSRRRPDGDRDRRSLQRLVSGRRILITTTPTLWGSPTCFSTTSTTNPAVFERRPRVGS